MREYYDFRAFVVFFVTAYLLNQRTDLHSWGFVRFDLAAQVSLEKKQSNIILQYGYQSIHEHFKKEYHDYNNTE